MIISRIYLQVVHQKTAACLCLTTVKNEDKLEFSKILEAIKVLKLNFSCGTVCTILYLLTCSFCGLSRQTSTTSTRSTGRSGEEASWDPSLKPRPKLRRGFLPRRLPREWTKLKLNDWRWFCFSDFMECFETLCSYYQCCTLIILCSFVIHSAFYLFTLLSFFAT